MESNDFYLKMKTEGKLFVVSKDSPNGTDTVRDSCYSDCSYLDQF